MRNEIKFPIMNYLQSLFIEEHLTCFDAVIVSLQEGRQG